MIIQIVVPPLPDKAWGRQLPFRSDDGIFDEEFIEDRRKGLEQFINKCVSIIYIWLPTAAAYCTIYIGGGPKFRYKVSLYILNGPLTSQL
jgi:hypothetical protein